MLSALAFSLLPSCSKEATGSLGSLPKAAFNATVQSNGYSVALQNATSTPTIAYWKVPALNLGYSDLTGDTLTLNFTFPGTYNVQMLAEGQGGLDTLAKDVTTTQPNPYACDTAKALGFIASCTSKTWKLNPDAGAYKVGPSGPDDGSWWSSSVADVTTRSCEFDDEYTFSFDANGTFVYNSHGDFFGDGYMGDNTGTCQPESNYTAVQKPWGSGTFKFAVIEGAGVKKLGQLKVIGLGAHIGLQKVTNAGENTSGPVSSITYDIIRKLHMNGYDIMVLGVNLGYGWWTFTLRSY